MTLWCETVGIELSSKKRCHVITSQEESCDSDGELSTSGGIPVNCLYMKSVSGAFTHLDRLRPTWVAIISKHYSCCICYAFLPLSTLSSLLFSLSPPSTKHLFLFPFYLPMLSFIFFPFLLAVSQFLPFLSRSTISAFDHDCCGVTLWYLNFYGNWWAICYKQDIRAVIALSIVIASGPQCKLLLVFRLS